jgi:hypothetical protein
MKMVELRKYFSGSVIARLVTSILLFIALSNLPIGYYKFLRWVVCATALYTAFISYNKKEQINIGVWLFVLIAILFNPIIPFYLGRQFWQISDIIVSVIFITSTFFIREII